MAEPIGPEARTSIAAHDYDNLAGKALKIAFLINIVAPAILFGVVFALRTSMGLDGLSVPYETLSLLFFVLLIVAVVELGAGFFIRKTLFAPEKVRPVAGDTVAFAKLVQSSAITLSALGASAMIYGSVVYMLGANLTRVAAFALIALICFRLLRPSAEFLREAVDQSVR